MSRCHPSHARIVAEHFMLREVEKEEKSEKKKDKEKKEKKAQPKDFQHFLLTLLLAL